MCSQSTRAKSETIVYSNTVIIKRKGEYGKKNYPY
jgi:hypothetical protein